MRGEVSHPTRDNPGKAEHYRSKPEDQSVFLEMVRSISCTNLRPIGLDPGPVHYWIVGGRTNQFYWFLYCDK